MSFRVHKVLEEARMACSGLLARVLPSSQHIQPHKVVFSAYRGGGYGCNPKYVAEALLRLAKDKLDLVWLTRERDPSMPPEIRQVKWGSAAAAREWATARVWVDNVRTRRHVAKKLGQFYVQTWHGCLSPKPLEADIEPLLSQTYIRGAKQDSKDADLFICNNVFFEAKMRSSFWYDGPILRCGLPRNTVLINSSPDVRAKARAELGVSEQVSICLFAPTFRDDGENNSFGFRLDECACVLQQRFGMPFVFVLRLHPNAAAQSSELLVTDAMQTTAPQTSSAQPSATQAPTQASVANASTAPVSIIDASHYADPMELLCATDVVISDYSSMLEDFALLGRPGFQFVPNAKQFERTRGFYYPLESRPFPLAYTEEELFNAILSYDETRWSAKRDEFFASIGFDDDGHGDEVVAKLILDVLQGRK